MKVELPNSCSKGYMSYRALSKKLNSLLHEIKVHNKYLVKQITELHENEYSQKLWATNLYLTIINLLENIIILLNNPKPIAVPSLVRDAMDAYINLLNVIQKYNDFIRHEKYELNKDIEKFNEIIKNFEQLNFEEEEKRQLLYLHQQFSIRAEALILITPKNIKQFEKKNDLKLHETDKSIFDFYPVFSGHSHNNITALSQRHVIKMRGKYRASQSSTIDKELIYVSISTLLQILQMTIIKYTFFYR